MFQRILVPLDDPTVVNAAVRIATAVAHRTGAELILARSEPAFGPVQNVIGAREALQRQVNMLRRQGIHAEYTVEIGSREDGLVAAARDRYADLVLLVPAQRQRLELLWYSRRAAHILNELPAPLLVWPETQLSPDLLVSHESTVMAPLDGGATAERALPFAVKLAEHYHRPLTLMHSIASDTARSRRDSVHGATNVADQVQKAESYLRTVKEQLARTTTTPVRTVVLVGEPGTQLLDAVTTYHAGVIAFCPHSHATRERYFMGCVATQLLRQATVPMLIVPPHLETAYPVVHSEAAAGDTRTATGVTS